MFLILVCFCLPDSSKHPPDRQNFLFLLLREYEDFASKPTNYFEYKNSNEVSLQFTSTNASAFYETPILTCRLTELLAGEVSLKKTVLTFEEMERAAECAGVIPLYLNITDGRGNITEKVQLNKEKKRRKMDHSLSAVLIYTIHALYTMPKKVPSITVRKFLQRGFPSKKTLLIAIFCCSLHSSKMLF